MITDFRRLYENEQQNSRKTLEIKNVINTKAICDGKIYFAGSKADIIREDGSWSRIQIN